jgi:hypothetical protein
LLSLVEGELDAPRYAPTPLLVNFYADMANKKAIGEHAGYLYESAVSRHGINARARTLVYPAPADGDTEAGSMHRLEVFDEGDEGAGESSVRVVAMQLDLVVTDDHPVVFTRRLRYANITVAGRVILGKAGNEFEIASSEITSSSLEIGASVIVARTRGRGDRIIIATDGYDQRHSNLRVEQKGQGELIISWPSGQLHPWGPYYRNQVLDERPDATGALHALMRILSWFKRDKKEDFARYKLLIDNVAVGRSPVRQRLLDYLISQGIITADNRFYKLNMTRARQAGINREDLRAGNMTESLALFLQNFLEWEH